MFAPHALRDRAKISYPSGVRHLHSARKPPAHMGETPKTVMAHFLLFTSYFLLKPVRGASPLGERASVIPVNAFYKYH